MTTTATTTTTDERAALLAQIRANEMAFAEAHSLAYCRKPLAELDAAQLRNVVAAVKNWRRECGRDTTPGVCWQCGCEVAAGGSECRPCHEGIKPISYQRTMRGYFLA
jgi:hypothetical protein